MEDRGVVFRQKEHQNDTINLENSMLHNREIIGDLGLLQHKFQTWSKKTGKAMEAKWQAWNACCRWQWVTERGLYQGVRCLDLYVRNIPEGWVPADRNPTGRNQKTRRPINTAAETGRGWYSRQGDWGTVWAIYSSAELVSRQKWDVGGTPGSKSKTNVSQ